MNKKDRDKFFEEWLRAYTDHLHLVRHGTRLELVPPADFKPPLPSVESADKPPRSKVPNR